MKRREREQMKKKKNIYKEWKKKWTFRCKWRAWLCGLTFTNNPSSPYTKTRLHTHHNVSVFLIDEKKKKAHAGRRKKSFCLKFFLLHSCEYFFFFSFQFTHLHCRPQIIKITELLDSRLLFAGHIARQSFWHLHNYRIKWGWVFHATFFFYNAPRVRLISCSYILFFYTHEGCFSCALNLLYLFLSLSS